MLREKVGVFGGHDVIVMDSASQIEVSDRDAIVIAASNGGRESARAAILAGCAAVVFNDAGVGKDDAGIIGLAIVDAEGIAGMAISHNSAEISDGLGTWQFGIISATNRTADSLGVEAGMSVQRAVESMCTAWDGVAR